MLDQKFREAYSFKYYSSRVVFLNLEEQQFRVFYSTAESTRIAGGVGDWVIIKTTINEQSVKWLVCTSKNGALKGKRFVAGHEGACRNHYNNSRNSINELTA